MATNSELVTTATNELPSETISNPQNESSTLPCEDCRVVMVDCKRNTRRLCKRCADKAAYHNIKRQKLLELSHEYSFKEGCLNALSGTKNNESDAEHAYHATMMLKCQPVQLTIPPSRGQSSSTHVYGLFNERNFSKLSASPFVSSTMSEPLTCVLQLPHIQEDENEQILNSTLLVDTLANSWCPKLDKQLGPYADVDEVALKMLNFDFRFNPELLSATADLFKGAIIKDKVAVMIITCEIYSRNSSIDAHAESSGVSTPSNLCRYEGLSCQVLFDSDGKKLKRKLIVGSTTMNILVTCSAIITDTAIVNVGPDINLDQTAIRQTHANVYLREGEVKKFKAEMTERTCKVLQNISGLRQLTSGFDHVSTYATQRCTLADFSDDRFMPSTIFTFCDLPGHDGYGASARSATKMASKLLQMFAVAVIASETRTLHKSQFASFLQDYEDLETRQVEQEFWRPLRIIMDALKEDMANEGTLNVISFAKRHNLSAVGNLAGNKLAAANMKIAENIKRRLQQLYA